MADTQATSFTSPESKTIRSACYDPVNEVMEVQFTHGKAYVYSGITPQLWIEFEQASSKGTFFAHRIRPLFAGRKKE